MGRLAEGRSRKESAGFLRTEVVERKINLKRNKREGQRRRKEEEFHLVQPTASFSPMRSTSQFSLSTFTHIFIWSRESHGHKAAQLLSRNTTRKVKKKEKGKLTLVCITDTPFPPPAPFAHLPPLQKSATSHVPSGQDEPTGQQSPQYDRDERKEFRSNTTRSVLPHPSSILSDDIPSPNLSTNSPCQPGLS